MGFEHHAADHQRRYNAATANAVVYVGDEENIPEERRLIVHEIFVIFVAPLFWIGIATRLRIRCCSQPDKMGGILRWKAKFHSREHDQLRIGNQLRMGDRE